MKKIFTLIFLFGALAYTKAQDTTLEHIPPEQATETPNYWGETSQGADLWGYYIGHNAYGDEEFGEKYEIPDHGHVVAIVAYFGGEGSSNNSASMKVYDVAEDGMPNDMLGSLSFQFDQVTTDGVTPTMLSFEDDVHVEDEFFVTVDLGDYSHDPLEGDTIVVMMGPDGSRPESDDVFGRNVIRWHSHDGPPEWKDFQTQNFTPLSTYFAIYPVMEGNPLSIDDGFIADSEISMFPVPCVNELNVRFNALETREVIAHIFNMEGKILQNDRFMASNGENLVQFDMSAHPAGSYVVSLQAEGFRYAKVITK